MSNKYKTTLRIHQVLSTDIVIETNEVPTNKTIKQYVNNIDTPLYAMEYYDKRVVKNPVFKDWNLYKQDIEVLDVEENII